MPSRPGPRKPGHSAGLVTVDAGGVSVPFPIECADRPTGAARVASAAGLSDVGDASGASAASGEDVGVGDTTGGGSGEFTRSSTVRASRRCSAVFDHRQVSCEPKPLTPSVRKSVNAPHVTQIVTISQRRRVPSERRCVAAAHRTSAGGSTKIEKTGRMFHIIAVGIEMWATRDVAYIAIPINARAPTRSIHGALLNNSHHNSMTRAQHMAPIKQAR